MRYSRITLALIGSILLLVNSDTSRAQQQPDCGSYVNHDGKTVPRPCGNAKEQHPPHGATAVCRDGSYSHSQHHIGACSGHGGVRVYLKQPRP